MRDHIIRKEAGGWSAYQRGWDPAMVVNHRKHPRSPAHGLYATGFRSFDHLWAWLFLGAPGQPRDYQEWLVNRKEG